MATGADIPPELFRRILRDVCEDAEWLLDLTETGLNRKETIKSVTACSLTCVYWARICRGQLFRRVWIKNYEDMCAFRSLVVNTPTGFTPISEYVLETTLVQRVGDRPWLHLIRMQPSLLPWRRPGGLPWLYFCIEDSPNYGTRPQRSISQRLFASLPRIPPSSCLQCGSLTIDKPHFVTPHDLTSLLQKFSRFPYLCLTNVGWSMRVDLANDVLARHSLNMSSRGFTVRVHSSNYTAETAWLALTTMLRYSLEERGVKLQVLPSAQRVIIDISRCLCQGHEAPSLTFYRYHPTGPNGISFRNSRVCE